jgi:hypothetical protein
MVSMSTRLRDANRIEHPAIDGPRVAVSASNCETRRTAFSGGSIFAPVPSGVGQIDAMGCIPVQSDANCRSEPRVSGMPTATSCGESSKPYSAQRS